MDKNGVSFKILNMTFFRIFYITLAFFVVWLFTISQIQDKIEITDVQNTILTQRALYSPSSFIYTDADSGIYYPGIINITKFNDDTINNSFQINNIAKRFQLKYDKKQSTAYLNKKLFDRWEPLIKFDKYSQETVWKYVLVIDNNNFKKGRLRIDMVRQNE